MTQGVLITRTPAPLGNAWERYRSYIHYFICCLSQRKKIFNDFTLASTSGHTSLFEVKISLGLFCIRWEFVCNQPALPCLLSLSNKYYIYMEDSQGSQSKRLLPPDSMFFSFLSCFLNPHGPFAHSWTLAPLPLLPLCPYDLGEYERSSFPLHGFWAFFAY